MLTFDVLAAETGVSSCPRQIISTLKKYTRKIGSKKRAPTHEGPQDIPDKIIIAGYDDYVKGWEGVMTKERLKKYEVLLLEEKQLEEELRELLNISNVGSVALDGMPKSGELADTTAQLATDTVMLYARLNSKRIEIVRLRNEIEDCIEALLEEERILMRERYIRGRTWEEVCVVVNMSWRKAHRMHSDILKKLA